MPEVYVCTPDFEGGHLTHEVIETQRKGGYPYRLLLYRDQGLKPQSLIGKFTTLWKWALEDPECKFIVSQANDHHPQTEGWLKLMVEKMKAEPDIGVLSPQQMNNYRGEKPWGQFWLNKDGSNSYQWVIEEDPRWKEFEVNYDDFSHGFCMIRREVFTGDAIHPAVGFLDRNYGMGACDNIDMCYRVIAAGWRSVLFGGAYFRHEFWENTVNIWGKYVYGFQADGSVRYDSKYDVYHAQKWGNIAGSSPSRIYELSRNGALKPNFEGEIW